MMDAYEMARRLADDYLMPWEKRWDEPRSGAPKDVHDNDQKPETLLYGPTGKPLLQKVPRPIGFRKP